VKLTREGRAVKVTRPVDGMADTTLFSGGLYRRLGFILGGVFFTLRSPGRWCLHFSFARYSPPDPGR
jgi:hypothetical protein